MRNSARTFIAIKIVPDNHFLQFYTFLKNKLDRETIHWVDENNFHLTLRFIGNTSPQQIGKISLALEIIAEKFQSFNFKLKGTGYFESKGNPRVLFAKIEESKILKNLAIEIEKDIALLGFEKESRDYKPHLTFGRIKLLKEKNKFYTLVKEFNDKEIQTIPVFEIVFYQSILSSSAPIYKPIKIVKLR